MISIMGFHSQLFSCLFDRVMFALEYFIPCLEPKLEAQSLLENHTIV